MKKLILIFIILCLICGFLIGGIIKLISNFPFQDKLSASKGNFHLPEVTLSNLNNDQIKFHTIKTPTILFFWLPQSKSCQLQLEVLSQVKENYTSELKIIGIGIGALNKNTIKDTIKTKKVNFPIVIDKKTTLTQEMKVTSIPTLVLYQPTTEPKKITGFQTKVKLEKIIDDYFKNTKKIKR